jgi:hypothetical protein
MIPFFSWQMVAFGGVAIRRSDRKQAVQAMGAAAAAAKLGECMAISPEGTRSKTGQLLSFKKGPFYLWETLQTPIIPIVTMGSFELYPPGCIMSHPGRVYMRFLAPIHPHEAANREEMAVLVRRRMLEALKDVPSDAGGPLTWRQRVVCWINVFGIYFLTYSVFRFVPYGAILQKYELSVSKAWAIVAVASAVLTLLFYIYAVYAAPLVRELYAKTRDTVKDTVKKGVRSMKKQADKVKQSMEKQLDSVKRSVSKNFKGE